MKIFLTIGIYFVLGMSVFAQDQLANGELIINFTEKPPEWSIKVKIEAFGTVWDRYHSITSEFLGGDTTYSSNDIPLPQYHASDLEWSPNYFYPYLSLGLYEVSIWEGSTKCAWFFLDYRSSDLPPTHPGNIDVVLKYYINSKYFEMTYPIDDSIIDGEYLTIWNLKDFIDFQTSDLQDYWDNCLALIPSPGNNPRLIWGPYPEQVDIAAYNVYRRVGTGNFTLIYTTPNENTFEYIDTDYSISIGGNQLQYYVKAGYSTRELSPASNTVTTSGIILQKSLTEEPNYYLSQNYPNPFNPTTAINYSIPFVGQVSLKVFDILGREVVTLLNEMEDAGTHKIEYDASKLMSGVYFYQIKVGSFVSTRKFILLK